MIGIVIIAGHNILDYPAVSAGVKSGFWADLFYFTHFDFYPIAENHSVLLVYAIIPWAGIMLVGFGFGQLYDHGVDADRRRKMLLWIGVGVTVFFIVLRLINVYGDPVPWSVQPRGPVFTFLAFLNLNKYPPSLLFVCMTLGPSVFLLALLEKVENRFTNAMNIYGRVPMFYYVLHLFLIHLLVVIVFYLSGYASNDIRSPGSLFLFRPDDFGFPLWGVFLMWILVVLLLYPLCRKYNHYKSTHRKWWLSYL